MSNLAPRYVLAPNDTRLHLKQDPRRARRVAYVLLAQSRATEHYLSPERRAECAATRRRYVRNVNRYSVSALWPELRR